MKKQLRIVAIVVLCVLLIDQILKIWIKSNMHPGEEISIFGDWFQLYYTENPGMAFGTTFGGSIWAKLSLSIFRVIASILIIVYIIRQARKGVKTEYLVVIGLIFAGAFGNLIDSMLYDFIFPFDPCLGFNEMAGSKNFVNCDYFGIKNKIEVRHHGFLLGNVVDMFQWTAEWPSWVPWYDKNMPEGGNQIFPAIWNVADTSISIGVVMLILRNKVYFPKSAKQDKVLNQEESKEEIHTKE